MKTVTLSLDNSPCILIDAADIVNNTHTHNLIDNTLCLLSAQSEFAQIKRRFDLSIPRMYYYQRFPDIDKEFAAIEFNITTSLIGASFVGVIAAWFVQFGKFFVFGYATDSLEKILYNIELLNKKVNDIDIDHNLCAKLFSVDIGDEFKVAKVIIRKLKEEMTTK